MTPRGPQSGIPPIIRKRPIAEDLDKLREKPPGAANREPLSRLERMAILSGLRDGLSTRRITITQSIKNGQPFESRQRLEVGGPWWLFTQFVQFLSYRWSPDNRWDSTLRTSWRHSLPLSRRTTVVHCLFIRYARLIFSDSLNSLPV